MAKSVSLKDIHEEIRELRMLYKHLVDRLIPVEEPTKEEKRAVEERDEIVAERELLKTLGVHC
jgi:archaellum component FlaC